MSEINLLKDKVNIKTLNLVLLSIATGGIYLIIWLYKNHKIIDEITNKTTANDVYIIWVSVCVGLGATFSGIGDEFFDIFAGILTIASWVLYIVWAFKAKSAIQDYVLNEFKIDLPMNKFYLVIFNIYYINYCINDLQEVARKQEILSSNKPSVA